MTPKYPTQRDRSQGTIVTRLAGSEIEAAELEELPMVAEAAKVACFSEDGQGVARTNARNQAQELVVILAQRARNKRITIEHRRLQHREIAA